MIYKDKKSGRELNLIWVPHTDFWADGDGDLYLTEASGYCRQIRAESALLLILERKQLKSGECHVCEGTCLKSNSRAFGAKSYLGMEWEK